MGDSPKEVPRSEDRLTQSLGRIIPHEVHIPPYLQEILLRHPLLREVPILGKVLPEVTTVENLAQQQPPPLLVHRSNHQSLW